MPWNTDTRLASVPDTPGATQHSGYPNAYPQLSRTCSLRASDAAIAPQCIGHPTVHTAPP
ncbi:hypothetical protein GZL_p00023 (plasmid) [Streptomyces sp. 769]|nr:hypothetical protein GZL_p00023 [Streptomyces sp. 769]